MLPRRAQSLIFSITCAETVMWSSTLIDTSPMSYQVWPVVRKESSLSTKILTELWEASYIPPVINIRSSSYYSCQSMLFWNVREVKWMWNILFDPRAWFLSFLFFVYNVQKQVWSCLCAHAVCMVRKTTSCLLSYRDQRLSPSSSRVISELYQTISELYQSYIVIS